MNTHIQFSTNESLWNSLLLDKPWNVFQRFEWGQLQEKLGNTVHRLTLVSDKKIIALAQVITVKARRGTFLHVRHGPVFTSTQIDPKMLSILLASLTELGRTEKAVFIRINPMISNTPENALMLRNFGFGEAPIHAMDAEICWILDLNKSEAELLGGMRKTTRYLIRQAEKIGVAVTPSTSLGEFTKLYKETTARHGFIGHTDIQGEFEVFAKNGNALLLEARHNKEVLAAALIIFIGKQAIYHHGASRSTKIPATYLLQWTAIREAKKRGCQFYNFWGIAPKDKPNHPWRGITLFKQGFGGREAQFMHAHDLPLSPFYFISYTIEWVRKIRKGY